MITKRFETFFKKNFCWRLRDNTFCRKLSSGVLKRSTPTEAAAEWIETCNTAGAPASETVEEITAWILSVHPDKTSAAKPKVFIPNLSQTSSWIMEKLKDPKCPYRISKRADMITYNYNGTSVCSNEDKVIAWLNQKVRDLDLKKSYTNGDISDGWKLLKDHFYAADVEYLKSTIKYDGSVFVDEFIRYIYDYLQVKEDYDIFEMLFKHWLWCLKRRICDKPVVWHIWLNFNGAQGIGKTQLMNRMFNLLNDYKVETSLKIMNDLDREYRKFTDNFIIFFDELNTGDNSDSDISLDDSAVDAIKQIMTQEMFTVRLFHTQDQSKVKNTFVPISCANKHLYDIIYDGDAMRRWFEFNCQRSAPPESYDELNSMLERFIEAIKGIDEDNDKGYWVKGSDTDKKIVAIQKGYIPTNTSTNCWIEYCELKPDEHWKDDTAFDLDAYRNYTNYCKAVGKFKASMARVESVLKRLWPQAVDDKGTIHISQTKYVTEVGALVQPANAIEKAQFLSKNRHVECSDIDFGFYTDDDDVRKELGLLDG